MIKMHHKIFRFILQVSKLVLIDASVYAEGTGEMSKLPRAFAYAGVSMALLEWVV